MPDVGDLVTPTLTVSPSSGSTDAALTITAPDGTTTAGTGEATADTGATWTADAVTLTAAGMWVLTWTVTGTGAGVQHQRIVVTPTPTPVPSPTALATISDLILRAGSLTDAQIARAPTLLADASALIRGHLRQTITAVVDDEVVLRPVGSQLRLPQRPVTAVEQVEMIGTGGTADRVMGVAEWQWDGADLINIWPCPTVVTGVLPSSATYADTYRVTYSHGHAASPADVVAVCCRMVLAVLLAPTLTQGLVQERIGQYSYQYGQAPGQASPGATPRLTEVDMRDLRRYRRTAGTIQTRAR